MPGVCESGHITLTLTFLLKVFTWARIIEHVYRILCFVVLNTIILSVCMTFKELAFSKSVALQKFFRDRNKHLDIVLEIDPKHTRD